MNDQQVEEAIVAKGSTAPRVTPADIAANIVSEHYFTAADGAYGKAAREAANDSRSTFGWQQPQELDTLTFCVLVLRNGYTVVGKSAPASPANFDAEIGQKIARADAVDQMWPLMGYALRERLQHTLPVKEA